MKQMVLIDGVTAVRDDGSEESIRVVLGWLKDNPSIEVVGRDCVTWEPAGIYTEEYLRELLFPAQKAQRNCYHHSHLYVDYLETENDRSPVRLFRCSDKQLIEESDSDPYVIRIIDLKEYAEMITKILHSNCAGLFVTFMDTLEPLLCSNIE